VAVGRERVLKDAEKKGEEGLPPVRGQWAGWMDRGFWAGGKLRYGLVALLGRRALRALTPRPPGAAARGSGVGKFTV